MWDFYPSVRFFQRNLGSSCFEEYVSCVIQKYFSDAKRNTGLLSLLQNDPSQQNNNSIRVAQTRLSPKHFGPSHDRYRSDNDESRLNRYSLSFQRGSYGDKQVTAAYARNEIVLHITDFMLVAGKLIVAVSENVPLQVRY